MNAFETIKQVILQRRSNKPPQMNGKKIDDAIIEQLLELADWAPTHANTEPWRFVVYSNDGVKKFCADHAELYKKTTPEEKYIQATYDKFLHMGDMVSNVIAVYMKRGSNPNIPALEEIAATSAAVQNILLGAQALDIAVLWSTGGRILHPAMKEYLGLAEEDVVMGVLYMGYTDKPATEGKRLVPLNEKVVYHK
ncbi:MAG: nitroreductase [Filimonas sp.]|nr:nitroreductase [Filimonas sp.]